jgi:predicted enzyme related to lactoylglutathione lyase
MSPAVRNPVVHLELRTDDALRACAFYTRLFGWRVERIHVGTASYLALSAGGAIDVGVVADDEARRLWLPYVEVADVHLATAQARQLGAAVSLEPREGPTGWRSVIAGPEGVEFGLWQPRR